MEKFGAKTMYLNQIANTLLGNSHDNEHMLGFAIDF